MSEAFIIEKKLMPAFVTHEREPQATRAYGFP